VNDGKSHKKLGVQLYLHRFANGGNVKLELMKFLIRNS